MKFKDLYLASKQRIAEAIIGMWKETAPKMVDQYKDQLDRIISECISDNIVVENMARWEPAENDTDWRKIVNPNIWRKRVNDEMVDKGYSPYKHQVESWEALLQRNKSIVVTSGTGSGKTECFMVPLIHDLTKDQQPGVRTQAVEAIFLYPLNALMEDQKERIHDYITFSEKKLNFAVYNGSTPENQQDSKYRGEEILTNELGTRDAIRHDKPNILFTNPSMLEYMLLREEDKAMFSQDLKWIVIDETHTYKGAAGAELAMLIRRVLKACGKKANDIKFATSSATIGSGEDAQNKLKKFISDITGQAEDRIEIISARRSEPQAGREYALAKKLKENDFILLKDLIPEGRTIESKLETLDRLADAGLRVRVHYYLQTLNFGLYIDPRNVQDGKFLLSKSIPLVDGKLDTHYLDAYYCKECGALLGFGEINSNKEYSRKTKEYIASLEESLLDDSDDDGDGDDDSNSKSTKPSGPSNFYVGLDSKIEGNPNDGIWYLDSDNKSKFSNICTSEGVYKIKENDFNKDGKEIHYCPCCGKHGAGRLRPMKSFHMSAAFISRLIAPILLEQTTPIRDKDGNIIESLPSCGCKYITFADSRQSAAGPTLQQNLETEEVWVTGVLYKKLLNLQPLTDNQREEIANQMRDAICRQDTNKIDELSKKLNNNTHYLTWNQALDALNEDPNSRIMYLAFAKPDDKKDLEAKYKYLLAALYRTLNKRPEGGQNSPENWGLLCTTYPALEEDLKDNNGTIKRQSLRTRELPQPIKEFNTHINKDNLKITSSDWCDFVKLFIDMDIRTNGRFFFRRTNGDSIWNNKIDIESARAFRTKVETRRPIDGKDNKIELNNNRYSKLLLRLLGKNTISELTPDEKTRLEVVIEQLKQDLETYHIKEVGQELNWRYNRDSKKYEIDWDRPWKDSRDKKTNLLYYMNLTQIAFKLYDSKVWFDENLRIPLDTTFKGYSPYRNQDTGRYDVECKKVDWAIFNQSDGQNSKDWFSKSLSPISHKWTGKLGQILDYSTNPNTIYIQAEHTAQVARDIIKDKTEKFKGGEINIMACSTTMEMGVDLGDLELVVMNNVPPHPANYKQRAGRAGRGDQNKSGVVTICGSDASGVALMDNPLKNLISAPIEPPRVDLNSSPQLIQRHINSYLFRKFINEEGIDFRPGAEGENDRGYKLCKLFTKYDVKKVNQIRRAFDGDQAIWPDEYESIEEQKDSNYKKFLGKLDEYASNKEVSNKIIELSSNTLNNQCNPTQLIQNTKTTIEEIATKLDKELLEYKNQWEDEHKSKRLNYSFTSILGRNLLSYLSTHQFTPNANMPVGIVEMVIDKRERHSADNPSRDMKVALSEYAPGKMVFINGVTYLMGGVKWNPAQANQWLKRCANNHVWLNGSDTCDKCQQAAVEWGDGFGRYIEVMTPIGFIPHKETSRITQKNSINHIIDTALIGVGDLPQADDRLYATRTNINEENSKILYFNKGFGRGFYVCKKCGYAVPVPKDDNGDIETLVANLYPLERKPKNKKESTFYHNQLGGKCDYDGKENSYFRNIVFGGEIQTDYCEIVLFERNNEHLQFSEENYQIATTLGLTMCRAFAQQIGCERSDIDFIVRNQDRNLSICIYDTAKGGVGYSKKLGDAHRVDSLLDVVRALLQNCTSADKLLDRTTMQYADRVNVKATYEWLEKEYRFRGIVPENITGQFPNATIRVSNYTEVSTAITNINAGENCVLFFDGSTVRRWNFSQGDVNWNNNRYYLNNDNAHRQRKFAVCNLPAMIPSSDIENMRQASRNTTWWSFDNPFEDIFPIAQTGNILYISSNKECTKLNGKWAAEDIYSVDYNQPITLNDLNVVEIGNEYYRFNGNQQTTSDALFDILYMNSPLLRDFINACQQGHHLSFTYHEEYLRTHLGMTITMQFILKFAQTAGVIIENVHCIGEVYNEERLLNKYPNDYDWNTKLPRKIFAKCLNDEYRDNYLFDTFLEPLIRDHTIQNYTYESLPENSLPHWRALVVKNNNTGAIINILPNGGFENGWHFDRNRANGRNYFPSNCDVNTSIPIRCNDQNGLLYDIKVGELE